MNDLVAAVFVAGLSRAPIDSRFLWGANGAMVASAELESDG